MKRCADCRRVYDRDAVVCPVDGISLQDFASDPLVGRTIAKRYRLVQRLGGGPLAAVYLAEESATGRRVAVKLLAKELRCDDETLKQCRWDARFASASHPASIVRIYEVDRTDEGQIFIAMDYLEGENLADIIHREGRLDLSRALRLASQMAHGLSAALSAGVVHREIKPRNVMVVGSDECIKLTDFGIARLRRIATVGSLSRSVGVAHEYAAPEQLLGGDAADRTDIYGLGAVLYAMLTGAEASTEVGPEASGRLWRRPPVRALRPDVPAALEHLLVRAMEREPERRPSSMSEVAERLLELTASIIEKETAVAMPRAAYERALEPSVFSPGAVVPPLSEPVSEHADLELGRARGAKRQAYREQWLAPREQWRETWQTYREQWLATWRARWQTRQAAWQVRREQGRLSWYAYKERRQAQRERRRLMWQAYRAQYHDRREQWQAQRLAYREQWHAQCASWRARLQMYREHWRAQRERWQTRQAGAQPVIPESGRQVAFARRRSDRRLKWVRANGRALASSGVAALVVAGVMAWTAVSRHPEKRSEAPAPAVRVAARDAVSGGELADIEPASPTVAATPPTPVESKTSRPANLARPRPLPVTALENERRLETERRLAEPIEAPRPPERVATKIEPPLDAPRPSEVAQVAPRVAQLTPQQIARIQSQAEQKLRQRGLLRVSAADRWGVTLETGPSGEVNLTGVLRDMALYNEAVRLVREVPDVKTVRGSVEVRDLGAVSIVQSDAALIQAEVQQKLRTRGLLRESTADRWGVTVQVNPDGDVMLEGAVRDAEMYSEALTRAQEVAKGRQVKQDIRVMERSTAQ